jgi:hypothetical protein
MMPFVEAFFCGGCEMRESGKLNTTCNKIKMMVSGDDF